MEASARKLKLETDVPLRNPPKYLRLAGFFFIANITTGVLNYFFQIFASRTLDASDFSRLNAWFADLAVLFFIGGIIQYYGIFFPASRKSLRQAIVGINLGCLGLAGLWALTPPGQTLERSLLIFAGTTAFSWLMGQIQYRKMFATLGVANLAMSLTRLAVIFLPLAALTTVEQFRLAYFANYFPALWLISWYAWRLPDTTQVTLQKNHGWQLWFAPVVMSLATAVIPQFDMVLISRLMPDDIFHDYARASLFARGIYFSFLVLAQWLLPFQIQGDFHNFRNRMINPALAVLSVASAIVIAWLSPWIVSMFFHWDHAPSTSLVFFSCLNVNLLTWLFLLIQKKCAEGQAAKAAIALSGLAVEAAAQFLARWPSEGYFSFAILFQAVLVWFLTHNPRKSATSRL